MVECFCPDSTRISVLAKARLLRGPKKTITLANGLVKSCTNLSSSPSLRLMILNKQQCEKLLRYLLLLGILRESLAQADWLQLPGQSPSRLFLSCLANLNG